MDRASIAQPIPSPSNPAEPLSFRPVVAAHGLTRQEKTGSYPSYANKRSPIERSFGRLMNTESLENGG
ncbi:hypothetical protein NQZ68_022978 [Dissostichus eleginoides]|nr:hypothetical protein NQZ68_022978 [Dissostichus eleginoides]